jgi:hypothetical protein
MKCHIWSIAVHGVEIWDTSENGSEIPGKIWDVTLQKDGEGQVDQ